MKGIVLAGGSGTRLHPITSAVSKQLLPIYNKPMIYYPLSVLMLAEIRDILIISTPEDIESYKILLGDGSDFGISLDYAVQENPNGLAEAFIIGEKFIKDDDVCLVLGDNIFYGNKFQEILLKSKNLVESKREAVIYGYYVNDPKRYGVVHFDQNNKVLSIEEKPNNPKSNYAVIGLYFYPNSVVDIAKSVKPSNRGEIEITSINQEFLKRNKLSLSRLSRGFAWLDTGTTSSLYGASEFVRSFENRTNLKIACLEEIALKLNYIDKENLLKSIENKGHSEYYDYVRNLAKF